MQSEYERNHKSSRDEGMLNSYPVGLNQIQINNTEVVIEKYNKIVKQLQEKHLSPRMKSLIRKLKKKRNVSQRQSAPKSMGKQMPISLRSIRHKSTPIKKVYSRVINANNLKRFSKVLKRD